MVSVGVLHECEFLGVGACASTHKTREQAVGCVFLNNPLTHCLEINYYHDVAY